jgi:predicted nucleic acid-binding Zn ribbon protein
MPTYLYQILNKDGEPTGETIEIVQSMKDEPLTVDPESGRPIRKAITAPAVRDGRPFWERCADVREHLKNTKPKWVHDKEKGIRERFDPKKHT